MTNSNQHTIDTSWSELVDSNMGKYVRAQMSNSKLHYHNFNHIERMYAQALAWELPYDAALDAAILWHDAVYDDKPNKEARSARLMECVAAESPELFGGINLNLVSELIMTTAGHGICTHVHNLLLKLDLAELGDRDLCRKNFWDLNKESQELYGITSAEAAQGTLDFMSKFHNTVRENLLQDGTGASFENDGVMYWCGVLDGVMQTITIARAIVDYDARINA
jgi:predicted metal-dependent HD superfamily phosphohydrolase